MPYIIALLGLLAGAYFWMMRARAAADAARDLTGVARDVMAAARRFGFRRKLNTHPVESLEEPDVAIAGAGIAEHLHQHIVPRWALDSNFFPIVAGTKAVPRLLGEVREEIANAWPTSH